MAKKNKKGATPLQFRKLNLSFPTPKKREEKMQSAIYSDSDDFREDTGRPVSIFEFNEKMLGRKLSEKQIEFLKALWGEDGRTWSTNYHEHVLLIGMKGGKNFIAESDVAYVCYFITCLKDPHAYFSKLTKRPIPYTREKNFDIVNVSSVGSNQARRAFFESVKNVLKLVIDPRTGERWFEKFGHLDFREKTGHFNKDEVVFPTRGPGIGGIRLLSFNSTSTAPEGVHILRFYADELSRANTKATYKEASDLLELGLNNTIASFPNRVGKVLEWSYPNDSDYDLTVERYEKSQKEEQIFGRKYPTWEFNPSITREMLEARFKIDHDKANRVYGCEKSTSKDNFFQPYSNKLDELPHPDIKNRISYAIKTVSKTTNKGISEFTTVEILGIEGDNKKRCFTCDPASVKDRFTILGGYAEIRDPLKMELFIGDTTEVISTNIKPIIDFALVIEPYPNKPIDYISIGDIFSHILKAFPNTISINSDHFQNEKLRQEIISKGVSSEAYFFSNTKQIQLYTMLRANVWNNNLTLLSDKHRINIANKQMNITEAAIWEAKTLIKDGNKIDHPAWGSKDIIDALAILNYDIMHLEVNGIAEDFDLLSDERIALWADKYFNARKRAIESGIEIFKEKDIVEFAKKYLGLSDRQFNVILDSIRRY